MGLLARLSEAVTGSPSVGPDLGGELAATAAELSMLKESFADLERLYTDDIGWAKLGAEEQTLSHDGRKRIAKLADLTVTANPLMKKGFGLRVGYVWGDGVNVTIRDDGAEGQDINAVWRQFWEEPTNRREFTSSEAQVRYERKLATGGEAFWALPTDKATGRVWIRRIPPREIVERICDPEDAAKVWLYKRVWTAVTYDKSTGKRGTQDRVTYYPALGFYPAQRPTSYDGKPIRWDAPMRPVTVNCPDEDWRGLGDVLAAMPWARMDKEFLEDLAVYMRALTRILGQVTGKNSKTAKAAAAALRAATTAADKPGAAPGAGAGSWAATDPNTTMSIVSKSGAHIDAESHRPLATYVAAGLEVPLTMLLGDPGISGARAVAETLDQPTENMARIRRQVHEELFRDIAGYVIDQAVIAGAGPLRGTVTKDGDRLLVELPDGDDRTVDVAWPEFDSTPLQAFVEAVAAAEELPPLEKFKLYAKAFKLEDIDDLVEALTDDDGNWIGPTSDTAAQSAVDRFRAGQDPAEVA
jgi:hypothetical protein